MAAGEDQAQPVVLDRIARVGYRASQPRRIVGDVLDPLGGVVERDEAIARGAGGRWR